MMRSWSCDGFKPVRAHTKGEARALFIAQAQKLELLTFQPKKLTRLPVGAMIRCLATVHELSVSMPIDEAKKAFAELR